MTTLVLVAGAVIIAIVVSAMAGGSSTWAEANAEHHIPDHLDGSDFHDTPGNRLLVVFSSNKCKTCAQVIESVSRIRLPKLTVEEVEIETRPDLHAKYDIDAVPTTVLAEPSGRVVKSFLGPAGRELIERAISDAWPDGDSGNL